MMPSNCSRCAYCCTLRVRLSLLEYLRILLKGYRDFTEKDTKGRKCIKLPDKKCFFLENNNCKIYSIRPKMCREYPGVDICPQGKK
ncbi:YkgJ family cysteine cluster protein [Candidatus Woesearchaeota archaeon]|nr:YkgJ family cysteine cluster protein [Candidatus Woesearchaeota archaeon]